ncbi:MAG: hypothetical protein AB7L09_02455 [Nitrospira sp.]
MSEKVDSPILIGGVLVDRRLLELVNRIIVLLQRRHPRAMATSWDAFGHGALANRPVNATLGEFRFEYDTTPAIRVVDVSGPREFSVLHFNLRTYNVFQDKHVVDNFVRPTVDRAFVLDDLAKIQ